MAHRLAVLALTLRLGAGCDTQTVDPGGAGGAGTSAASTTSAGGASGMPASGVTVLLVHGSDGVTVDLGTFPTQEQKGVPVIPLADVWQRGGFGTDPARVTFDFEGTDGFHPSSKAACKDLLTSAQLAQGYITPDTRTLLWSDALGFSGCYYVKQVAKIIAVDVP